MSKPISDFIENAIKGLKPDTFSDLIKLFQKEYWNASEVIATDGTNDGGNDLKIFIGKLPIKKNIQLTTQRLINEKVKEDLQKANENIQKYGFSNSFEYYWSQSISEDKLEEYRELARKDYGIDLQFFDAKALSQINCKCIKDYIYQLHGEFVKRDFIKVDSSSKVLYDLLSIGNDTSDIKNNLINSLIVFYVFEKEKTNINEIFLNLKIKLNDSIDEAFIKNQVNFLKTHKRLLTYQEDRSLIILSEQEKEQISDFIKQADILQHDFETDFLNILTKYQLDCFSAEIIDYLKNLYRTNYQLDIDETNNKLDFEDSVHRIYNDFHSYIVKKISNKEKTNELIIDIKKLCSNNNYINKISATTAFTSLYKSNSLEKYLNQNDKRIFIDTPLVVFLLCHKYRETQLTVEWDDIFYKTTINLIEIWEKSNDKIQLYTTFDYLKEVAGELQKALKTSHFLEFDFYEKLGTTKNTFINFYQFLKANDLFETENINDFVDFIIELGFDNINPDSGSFYADTIGVLKDYLEYFDIDIVFHKEYDDFEELKRDYEITLMSQDKSKSSSAIINDLRLIRYLADKTYHIDIESGQTLVPFLATWDTTFYDFRKKLIKKNTDKYSFFHIYNPSRLINKLSLENFKLNSEVITNDIFAYADANYNISSKVRALIDMIAPILGNKVTKNIKLVKKLADIRHKQIEEQLNLNDGYDINKNLPVEEVLIETINYFKSSDTKYTFDDFSKVFCDEKNNEFIINFVQDSIGKISFKTKFDNAVFLSIEKIIEENKPK